MMNAATTFLRPSARSIECVACRAEVLLDPRRSALEPSPCVGWEFAIGTGWRCWLCASLKKPPREARTPHHSGVTK
jgi:hypothetical protein